MTWFKVDDALPDCPALGELEAGPCFAQAVALWTLAGAWCAKHLTDGAVPRRRLRSLVPFNGDEAAAELVRVGLWETTEDGWRFARWEESQPTRAEVEATRERWRTKKRGQRVGMSPGDTHGDSPEDSQGVSPGSNSNSNSNSNSGSNSGSGSGSGPIPSTPCQGEDQAAPPLSPPPSAPSVDSPPQVIRELMERYQQPELLVEAREACSLSRKNGKLADSVWAKTLRQLEAFPAPTVEEACRTFAEKYGDGSKDEAYLVGIARRLAKGNGRGPASSRGPVPPAPPEAFRDTPLSVWDQEAAHG